MGMGAGARDHRAPACEGSECQSDQGRPGRLRLGGVRGDRSDAFRSCAKTLERIMQEMTMDEVEMVSGGIIPILVGVALLLVSTSAY